MEVQPDELFAQIGHLTIENKVLYGVITQLEEKIKELENPEDPETVEVSDNSGDDPEPVPEM